MELCAGLFGLNSLRKLRVLRVLRVFQVGKALEFGDRFESVLAKKFWCKAAALSRKDSRRDRNAHRMAFPLKFPAKMTCKLYNQDPSSKVWSPKKLSN